MPPVCMMSKTGTNLRATSIIPGEGRQERTDTTTRVALAFRHTECCTALRERGSGVCRCLFGGYRTITRDGRIIEHKTDATELGDIKRHRIDADTGSAVLATIGRTTVSRGNLFLCFEGLLDICDVSQVKNKFLISRSRLQYASSTTLTSSDVPSSPATLIFELFVCRNNYSLLRFLGKRS